MAALPASLQALLAAAAPGGGTLSPEVAAPDSSTVDAGIPGMPPDANLLGDMDAGTSIAAPGALRPALGQRAMPQYSSALASLQRAAY